MSLPLASLAPGRCALHASHSGIAAAFTWQTTHESSLGSALQRPRAEASPPRASARARRGANGRGTGRPRTRPLSTWSSRARWRRRLRGVGLRRRLRGGLETRGPGCQLSVKQLAHVAPCFPARDGQVQVGGLPGELQADAASGAALRGVPDAHNVRAAALHARARPDQADPQVGHTQQHVGGPTQRAGQVVVLAIAELQEPRAHQPQ